MLNLKKNTYDNLKDTLFSLCLRIRDKTEDELKKIFLAHSEESNLQTSAVDDFTYSKAPTKYILHILARIATYIECGVEQTNTVGFSDYVDRKRNNRTFDIEHILADEYCVFTGSSKNNDFDSESNFKDLRNKLGGLILLPRSRNRSLQDKPYTEKIKRYATENILAQTLTGVLYENNPQLTKFITESELNLKSYDDFNKAALEERHQLYRAIIDKVWSINDISS